MRVTLTEILGNPDESETKFEVEITTKNVETHALFSNRPQFWEGLLEAASNVFSEAVDEEASK